MHFSRNYQPSQAFTVFKSPTSSGASASLAPHSPWSLHLHCCSLQLCSTHTRPGPSSDFHIGYCFTSFKSWLDGIFSVKLSQNILFPFAALNPYLADVIVICFIFLCNTLLHASGLPSNHLSVSVCLPRHLPTPVFLGFPCDSAGRESTCNAGDLGLIPGLGRLPQRMERPLIPVFWPGEFHRLYSPWGRKESETTE